MIQRLIGFVLLALGVLYGITMLWKAWKDREAVRAERGRFPVLCAFEVPIYFLATLGISDFLIHTLLLRRMHLTEDENLPGTLIAAGLVPGAVIAFSLLRVENPVGLRTLLCCCAAIACGSLCGARLVAGLDGKKIKRIMGVALGISAAALILKTVVSAGTAGEATELALPKLIVAVIVSFFWGAVNMVGVPMKPAGTAMFLILELSPLATLTMVLVMGCIGPMSGGIEIVRGGRYHRKTACAAVIFGAAGALLGCLFAISISAVLLNILLLVVMLVAMVSMWLP